VSQVCAWMDTCDNDRSNDCMTCHSRRDCCCVNHLMLTPWRWVEVTSETCRRSIHEEIVYSTWQNAGEYYFAFL
jgi:hypothetical protein